MRDFLLAFALVASMVATVQAGEVACEAKCVARCTPVRDAVGATVHVASKVVAAPFKMLHCLCEKRSTECAPVCEPVKVAEPVCQAACEPVCKERCQPVRKLLSHLKPKCKAKCGCAPVAVEQAKPACGCN